MSQEKRYVGKYICSDYYHPRTKKQTKRIYIHLPLEILEDPRFLLEHGNKLLVSIENGIIKLEKI